MIELRWIWRSEPIFGSDQPMGRNVTVLQYRFMQYHCDASGSLVAMGCEWSDWQDVPTVKE